MTSLQASSSTVAVPLSSSSPQESFEPREEIAPFDWDGLYAKFQAEMDKQRKAEEAIFQDLERLTAYFQVWASTMHEHEPERASKRLRTRIEKAKQSEVALEEKRQHYIKVVEAFQSALRLLNG